MISSSSRKGSVTSRQTRAPSKFEQVESRVKFVRWLPKKVAGFAPLPGWIFINRSYYTTFDTMNVWFLGLVFHEAWHQVQMKQVGWFKWVWRYLTSPISRLSYEMWAHVFGEQQRYAAYPEKYMDRWAMGSVHSYFPWGGLPVSETFVRIELHDMWDEMRGISLELEYRL